MSFLLDTNIVSETRKARPDRRVIQWFESVRHADFYLSTLVIGELRQGVARLERRDRAQAQVLDAWLEKLVDQYADRIIPVTMDIAEEWGRLNGGDWFPVVDGLLAATAKVRGWTFVTRNTADVARTGVKLCNPFLTDAE